MIELLAGTTNVSGCEDQIRALIKRIISENGLIPVEDKTDCIYATKQGLNAKETILISVPMDMPGFLALYVENGKACLSPTGDFPFDLPDKVTLLDEDGKSFPAEKANKDQKDLRLQKNEVLLGDAFRLDPRICITKNSVSGFFASRYVLLSTLLSIMKYECKNNTIFLYTAGGATRSSKEKNVIRRLKPDRAIFLGSLESNKSAPILVLKDGKSFSDVHLVDAFRCSASQNKIQTRESVLSKSITKSEAVFASEGTPFLTLALPYEKLQDGREKISQRACEKFSEALSCFLTFPDQ